MSALLRLRDLRLGYSGRPVLDGVSLELGERGATALLGPVACGKSSLLRFLCGPEWRAAGAEWTGDAWYAGARLGERGWPVLVAQKARLLLESVLENVITDLPERSSLTRSQQAVVARSVLQSVGLVELSNNLDRNVVDLPNFQRRQMAIVRCIASNPHLLCVDEPTADLPPEDAEQVIDLLRRVAQRRAVVVVTHNRRDALGLGGDAVLLAGGRVYERGAVQQFFAAPRTGPGRDYVRTGSCAVPSPATPAAELDPYWTVEAAPPEPLSLEPAQGAVASGPVPPPSEFLGPRGFHWVLPGRLAGTPRPGLLNELADDVEALRRVGVNVLVNLTETNDQLRDLTAAGFQVLWEPVPDMQAPELDTARSLCGRVSRLVQGGHTVAYHCKAGLGRTGTLLAAQLLLDEGLDAESALRSVRAVEPRYVQSDAQEAFLRRFSHALQGSGCGKG